MILNLQLLQEMIDQKMVSVQKHPDFDLFIYNYTPIVQYSRTWNEITLQTRGLILDSNKNIVARPFGKFFNIEEHSPEEIPNLPFEAYTKLDGSLGILYWAGGTPYISTRGSFTSDQAKHATKILYEKYSHLFSSLDRNCTYLFEIIYPKNRIVVDYGDIDDIILLTIINNSTGEESLKEIGFKTVTKYDGTKDFQSLKNLNLSNEEGFIIKFSNNFRVKIKFSDYIHLHKIITGISNVAIWEYLSQNKPIDELLEKVPDEFFDWVKSVQADLQRKCKNILEEVQNSFKILGDRKETAMYFQTQKYPGILFAMLDSKSIEPLIWKLVKPEYSKPYKNYEE